MSVTFDLLFVRLLEEKAELLSLKSEAFESKRESELRIRDLKISEEKGLSLKKELEEIKKETEQKKVCLILQFFFF